MLHFFVIFLLINLTYSININVKNYLFFNDNFNNIQKCKIFKTKRIFERDMKNNIIYKQIKEENYPFKKYSIDDVYYGRILSINQRKIKLDILCDRKAYLNTSEYFSLEGLQKYIFLIIKIHNIIKVRIARIDNIHKKIIVDIKKYTNEEILSSFKNTNNLINSKILDIRDNYVLLYLAPKIHAKLIIKQSDDLNKYKIGNNILTKIDYFDKVKNELYVKNS
ncbi:conserved Plasmodium protein, unknown function [Plasmodium gallinaceum]|uniref:S1 motif domain-containing protein n=1 Tax=Plasmodium gallinaceum TaxID=5849 RepID=A0A1J1GPW7_PLAGA|nr:conserved Plasmodium protein, unknown function [Plasmodium gallinaceum]CRG93335.1 conserved Plasmodium protein, unknown function [Plasmodium gallinaceum]